MDSRGKTSSQENVDSKFRTLSNDAVNGKYKRKSRYDGSSSPEGSKSANLTHGNVSSSSKHGQCPISEVTFKQGVKDSDIDDAKRAAMQAAELVNRNLIGTGCMTIDQKKKLLWGNKKTTCNSEESTQHWDTSLLGDRERQEKFKKLMGVKGDVTVEHKPVIHDSEKQRELHMDLEKQYTAGLRRKDGRTVGLGL